MVDLGGYVIILTKLKTGRIKLYGSPADRPDCDEVLEINGRSLENASHHHIIQYIHQCIRSKTICLRVKRRTAGKLAPESSLIDAFVIGARAREHLQQIARDVNITPRDIAQLSRILDASAERQEAENPLSLTCGDFGPEEGSTGAASVPSSSIVSASSAPNVRTCPSTSASVRETAVPASDSSRFTHQETGEPLHQRSLSEHREKRQSSSRRRTLRRQSSSTKADPLAASEDDDVGDQKSGEREIGAVGRDETVRGEESSDRVVEKVALRESRSLPPDCSSGVPSSLHTASQRSPVATETFSPSSPPRPSLQLPLANTSSGSGGKEEDCTALSRRQKHPSSIPSAVLIRTPDQQPLQPITPHHHHYHHHVCRRASRTESCEDIEYYELNTSSVTPPTTGTAVTPSELTAATTTTPVPSADQSVSVAATSSRQGRMELLEMSDRPEQRNITKIAIEHRELPVDVPESFVGVVKTTPRYPPPLPLSSTRSVPLTATTTSSSSALPASSSTVGTKMTPTSLSTSAVTTVTVGMEGEKMRKYTDDVRNKKSEEELLRSSLRGSKKLQQLEHQQMKRRKGSADVVDSLPASSFSPHHSLINPAFEPDFEESSAPAPLPDVESVVQRLSVHLNGDVKDILSPDSRVVKLLSIYKTVMQQRDKRLVIPATSMPSSDLIQETIAMLQRLPLESHPDAGELFQILARYELEGVCSAFDHIRADSKKRQAPLPPVPPSAISSSPGKQQLQQSTVSSPSAHLASSAELVITSVNLMPAVPTTTNTISSAIPATTTTAATFVPSEYDPLTDAQLKESHLMLENYDPSVRVVRIEKSSSEPLGATVRNESDGSVIIGRIVKGGAAEKSGLLHEGDEILEVNGYEMKGRNVNQVCDLLSEMIGTLTFVIAERDTLVDHSSAMHSGSGGSVVKESTVINLKALFDYDPDDDVYIPCRELGICFTKGDVLHVIDQTDANWWQAYREGENDQTLAGLIPSISFQMQREAMKQSILTDSNNRSVTYNKNNNNNNQKKSLILFNCAKRSQQKRKKRKAQIFSTADEILTYDEVGLYFPRANIKRPIVLIGPTNIGRHELRQRLMLDTERFAAAVPHTSRPRRDGEIDGIDYHFISRTQFEQDIRDGRFVEHGEYEKNYYGTSLAGIEAVVQSGKICVLNLHVHSIMILRQGNAGAKLKPYFVFVSPPTQMDKLSRLIDLTTSADGSAPGHHHHHHHSRMSTSDLQSIIEEARDIESRYGHYFDMILTVTDIDRAYVELLREINALEREPQWIPVSWLK